MFVVLVNIAMVNVVNNCKALRAPVRKGRAPYECVLLGTWPEMLQN